MAHLFNIIFVLFVSAHLCFSQISPGARQIAMSNSDVALSNDVFSIFNNSSGLAQLKFRELGFYYSPAPFGVKELSNAFFCYHEPTALGSLGLGIMTYGFELYRNSKILFSYSNNFESIFLGGAIGYNFVSIQNYGSDYAFVFNFGGLIHITSDISWGIDLQNITSSTFGSEASQIPTSINTGFTYSGNKDMSINLAVEKEKNNKLSLRTGFEYSLVKYLSLRAGFSTEPDRYSGGFGLNYSYFQFDYSIFTHMELGLTHQFGLIISWADEKQADNKSDKFR